MSPSETESSGDRYVQPVLADTRFDALAEVAPVGIGIAMGGKTVWVNHAFAALFGYTPEEMQGLDPLSRVPPEYREAMAESFRNLLRNKGHTPPHDVAIIHKSGELRILTALSTYCVYRGQDAVMATVQDVTERRQQEEALQRSHQQLAALNRVATAVTRSLDLSDVLNIALDEALAIAGGSAGGIGLINEEQGTVEIAAHRNVPGELLERLGSVSIDNSWDQWVYASGQVLVLDDISFIPHTLEETHASQIKSALAVPLLAGDRILGTLTLTSTQMGHFRDIPRDFLMSLGAQIGMAISNARLFTEKADSEEHYRTLFETVPDAIVLVSLEGLRFIDWNKPFLDLGGYTEEDLQDLCLEDIAVPEDYALATAAVQERLESADPQEPGQHEIRCRRKDGKVRQLLLHLAPYMEGDRMVALQVVVRDVTEERKLQQQMLRAEKLSALGQLVSGVAHELNNPLAAILLAAEMLQQRLQDQNPKDCRKLDMIVSQVQRCSALTEDLRLFARSETPRRLLVDIPLLLFQARNLVGPAFRREYAHIRMECPEELPLVPGDPNQLEQVFVNLMNNAMQAMEDNEGPRELAISVELIEAPAAGARDILRLRFADTGPGIAPSVQNRLFEPFFSTKPAGKGTGLGLSVSLGIIQNHEGTIYLEPSDVGGVFVVELPVTGADETACATDEARQSHAPRDLNGLRVLVVDDEESIVSMLIDLLQASNCEVTSATSAGAALGILAGREFDVILCDVCMPLHEGLGACDAIRQGIEDRSERLLMMTGDTASADTVRLLAGEVLPPLEKPFSYESLVAAIRRALAQEPVDES